MVLSDEQTEVAVAVAAEETVAESLVERFPAAAAEEDVGVPSRRYSEEEEAEVEVACYERVLLV